MKRLLFAILFLLSAQSAQATIYYVDKDNGCPGTGTTGDPYCSIQNAVNAVAAGDTIRIRDAASAYTEQIQTNKAGTSGSPIIVEPDSGHNPTLYNTGNGGSCANFWFFGVASYWTIQNLNFDASGQNTCVFGAILVNISIAFDITGIQIKNNIFKGWGHNSNVPFTPGMSAITITGGQGADGSGNYPTDTLIEGNVFDSNYFYSITTSHTRNTTVRNNEIKGQKCGRGFDGATNEVGIYSTYYNEGMVVEANLIHDFDTFGSCAIGIQPTPTFAAYWCDVGSHNATISNNVVYNLDQNGSPSDLNNVFSAFFVEAGCDSHTLKNNLMHHIKTMGIYSSYHSLGGATNFYYNNFISDTGFGFFMKEGVAEVKNNVIRNFSQQGICHGCGSGSPALLSVTYNYNLYDDGTTQTRIGYWSGVLDFANWKSTCSCDAQAINKHCHTRLRPRFSSSRMGLRYVCL